MSFTWAQAATYGHPAVALASYEVMSVFVHVFPLAPAPVVYLSLGAVQLGAQMVPAHFGHSPWPSTPPSPWLA